MGELKYLREQCPKFAQRHKVTVNPEQDDYLEIK